MLTLYSTFFFLLWPLVLLVFIWRYGLRRTLRGLPERFGWGGTRGPRGHLIHAASVGRCERRKPFCALCRPASPVFRAS
ncbi:MAG: hypothetical protein IPP35_05080 [Elusimicrobia bacterium]|nr:hypothetical protein [Elusimicrobiota bacterium]